MSSKNLVRTIVIILVLSCTIGCDQASKIIVRQRVGYYEQISLVEHYFILTKVENTGAFLSLGNSLPRPIKLLFLSVLPLLALTFALIYLFRKNTLSYTRVIGICFIIGGGVGNIYDRLVYGSVTDFLHINLGFVETGIFNIADVAVMVGIILLFLESSIARAKVNQTDTEESDL